MLDANTLDETTTAVEYNEIATINRWVDELLTNDMYMISSNYNDVLPIVEKYNTSTFVYTGTISYKKRKGLFPNFLGVVYIAFPPSTPLGVYTLSTPSYETLYFSFVFDFEQSRTIHLEINYMPQKDRDGVIKSNLYWLLYQIKKEEE